MEWSLTQNKLLAFHRLMRTDKPIGALLLLWPTLWALWVATPGIPPLWILAVFVAGVWLMRAAGSTRTPPPWSEHLASTIPPPAMSRAKPCWPPSKPCCPRPLIARPLLAAMAQSAPLPHIFMEAFWTFFIVVGGSGATMGLVICYLRSRSAHLRSIGRLSVVPSFFNINEPVIFGTPIVMNPVFFIPFLLAPMVNAVLAWAAMTFDLIGRVISVVPWTAPAPIGAAWALGWDFRAAILVVVLACVSAIIYFPFFKVYEKQLLEQEAEEAQRNAEEDNQQVA